MAIQLGRWDCPVCGQIGNMGNVITCPSCGSPRGKDVEFYLPTDAQDITDENMLKEANAGVDWACDYCGADNKATATHCKSCGNERTKDDTDRQIKDYDLENTPHSSKTKKENNADPSTQSGRWDCPVCGLKGLMVDETTCHACFVPRGKDVKVYYDYTLESTPDTSKKKKEIKAIEYNSFEKKQAWENTFLASIANFEIPTLSSLLSLKNILLSLGTLALIFTIIFWPHSFKVEVVKHNWERSIEIENNALLTEEGWAVPATGTLITSFKDIHHYDEVFDHNERRTRTVREVVRTESYKCGKTSKGNGYFEDEYCDRDVYGTRTESYTEPVYRKVAVYQTKYRYKIYRWIKDHDIKDEGSNKNVHWPVEKFRNQNWREGKKTEKYTLFYRDNKNNKYNEEVNYDFWNKVNDNDTLSAKKSTLGTFYGVDKEAK